MNVSVHLVRGRWWLVAILFASACGDDAGDDCRHMSACGAADAGLPLPRDWELHFVATGGTQVPVGSTAIGTLILEKDGAGYAGLYGYAYRAAPDSQGYVTMSVEGDEFTMVFDQYSPCDATFTATGTIGSDRESLTGTYSGSDCNGSVEADFSATP